MATTPPVDPLSALCAATRLALGAAAVSLARVTDTGLSYMAADGAGATQIVGVTLSAGQGLAGYVAATGQSLAVADVQTDPRFARNVAERTGYMPADLLLVPVTDADGDVVGVLSILDRATDGPASSADALQLASAHATLASHLLDASGREASDPISTRLDRLEPGARAAAEAAVAALLDALTP